MLAKRATTVLGLHGARNGYGTYVVISNVGKIVGSDDCLNKLNKFFDGGDFAS